VLSVNDPLLLAVAAATFHRRKDILQRTQAELERFVAESATSSGAPWDDVVCRVAEGNPADEIREAAGRLGADLIVMATHGLGGVDRLVFGSTTERVLRRVTLPVLVVPPLKAGPIARVIVPIDPDSEWVGELKGAADVAGWFQTELIIAHVVRRPQLPPWLLPDRKVERTRLTRARRAVERARSKAPRGIKTATRVLIGDPADEIAAFARSGPSSLVVMALRGRSHARRGSVTYRVLAHGVAPVLVLPRPA
jgi:nucleotide-binding universal stress UspA family protein